MIAEKFFERCLEVSKAKGEEYTIGTGEKFKNFESVGERLGLSAEKVLMVYLLKHMDSIRYYILHGKEAQMKVSMGGYSMPLIIWCYYMASCMKNNT